VFRILAALLLSAGLIAASSVRIPVSPPAANPFGIFYGKSFANLEDYSHPGALLIAGNCNRYDPRFQAARARGAELLAYLNPMEVYDVIPCKLNVGFYMGGRQNVPLWPYPAYGMRVNYKNTRMADIRVGSPWVDHVVEYIAQLMREGKVDGVFLDNTGAKLWGNLSKWSTWEQPERDAWTAGSIDLVRRLDEKRRQINPRFLIVTNGFWDRGDERGFAGEQYVDGVMLEHSRFDEWHKRYAGRAFSDLGHRRVLVIARNAEDAQLWARLPGVTHVSDQEKYEAPNKPPVPFSGRDGANADR
jgi:hypothetical protein